jgi:hypothetical protein
MQRHPWLWLGLLASVPWPAQAEIKTGVISMTMVH